MHWRTYGQNYYTRHDYEEIDERSANDLMAGLSARLPPLIGRSLGSETVEHADDFAYRDPVDQSSVTGQGLRILFRSGARIIYRLSGTGTSGATLRVYIESYEPDPARHGIDTQTVLAELIGLSRSIAEIEQRTGRSAPSVVT